MVSKFETMSDKKIFSFTEPAIKGNSDLKSRWYISYNEVYEGGVKRPMKVYGQINRKHTLAERQAAANELLLKVVASIADKSILNSSEIKSELFNTLHAMLKRPRLKTKQSYESKVRVFCRWCEKQNLKRIAQISPEVMKRFFYHIEVEDPKSGNTYNDYKALLKAIFKRLQKDVIIDIKKLPENPKSDLLFQDHQKKEIIKYVKDTNQHWLLLFIRFMYYSLQRPGRELSLMQVWHIDLPNNRILVDAERAKNKKEEYVTIPEQLRNHILESGIMNFPAHYYVFGKNGPSQTSVGRDHWSRQHKKVLEALDYPEGYTCYSWNHTGVIGMFKALRDPVAVMHQKRHHSLEMLYNYLRQHALVGNDVVLNKYPTL